MQFSSELIYLYSVSPILHLLKQTLFTITVQYLQSYRVIQYNLYNLQMYYCDNTIYTALKLQVTVYLHYSLDPNKLL